MVESYKNFKSVKDDIQNLFNESEHCIYQSVSFVEKRLKYMKFQHFVKRTKYKFYKSTKDNVVRMILGIEYNKNSIKAISTLDYYDVWYNLNLSDAELSNAFSEILHEIGLHSTIVFENVTEDSKLFQLLKDEKFDCETIKTTGCGRIHIKETYEEYFGGLSKSSRQNIRTSYNRLKTDNHEVRLEVFDKNTLNKKIINMQQKLYVKRYDKNLLKLFDLGIGDEPYKFVMVPKIMLHII